MLTAFYIGIFNSFFLKFKSENNLNLILGFCVAKYWCIITFGISKPKQYYVNKKKDRENIWKIVGKPE
jgi:hypothetical protein